MSFAHTLLSAHSYADVASVLMSGNELSFHRMSLGSLRSGCDFPSAEDGLVAAFGFARYGLAAHAHNIYGRNCATARSRIASPAAHIHVTHAWQREHRALRSRIFLV